MTEITEKPWYFAAQHTLAGLGLDSLQQARVLEWFAMKVWVAGEEGSGDREYYGKSYDPLAIELSSSGGGTAHSYVFNFHDGGRHHPFDSLSEVEEWLTEELIGTVAAQRNDPFAFDEREADEAAAQEENFV